MSAIYALIQEYAIKPGYLPAWLQAFAAVVALGISVWAALRSTSIQRRRDRLQSRGIAVAIYPEILKLEIIISNVRNALRELVAHNTSLVGQSIAASVQQTAHIEIPPMLDRNVDNLFMLGDVAGPSCLQLVNVLMQHNALVDDVVARMLVMNADQWVKVVGHLEKHLSLLDGVIAKCKHEVQAIHDAIKG